MKSLREQLANCSSPEEARDTLQNLPWDHPTFVFVPGRYYVGMWYMELPHRLSEFGKGGNVTGMLWRFEAEPSKWTFLYRFRHYVSPELPGHDDEKNWYAGQFAGSEDVAFQKAREAMRMITGLAVASARVKAPLHFIEFRGDWERAMAVIEREKPFWLHAEIESIPPKNQNENQKTKTKTKNK